MKRTPNRPTSRSILRSRKPAGPLRAARHGREAQVLAAISRSAARAHDEVFELKHTMARARETGRAEAEAQLQPLREQLAAAREELAGQSPDLEALRWQLAEERRLHQEQRQRADHFEGRSTALESSTSWRLTAPLRAIIRAVRR